MSEEVYIKLREFLDTLPTGYPESPTGVEIKILKKLFTPDQAELTMKLKKEPEAIQEIAGRTGIEEKELTEKLEEMAHKGLIFSVRAGEERRYQAFQFLVGIYEFQLSHLDREFCELFEEYFPHFAMQLASLKTSQLRVIPVESAVGSGGTIESYNQVRELIKEQKVITVQDCICRKEQGLLENPCDKPSEICFGLGDMAQYSLDSKGACRQIDVAECLDLLDKAEAAGLVLQPSNTEELQWICCCCTCCCPGLKIAKTLPRPQDIIRSYYEAKIDLDECTACGDCIERCPMEAIHEGDSVSEVIDGRCIGCGLCVSTCPAESISLIPKSGMDAPPKDLKEMLNRIATERGVN